MEQVRSFIAIELSEEVKAGLSQLQSCLKSGTQTHVKWVDPNSIHLTLKFLGIIAVNKIGDITKAMEATVQGVPPFQLELKDLGVFPNLKRVQVAWVGLSGEIDKLKLLQQRVESNLAPLGFAPENRPFTPHLTLARLRESTSPQERQEFGQLFTSAKLEVTRPMKVDSLSLMRSQLAPGGAIYSQLSSVGLKGC